MKATRMKTILIKNLSTKVCIYSIADPSDYFIIKLFITFAQDRVDWLKSNLLSNFKRIMVVAS